MAVTLIASVAVWFITRDRLPEPIRIATASTGGLYHKLAQSLEPFIETETGHDVLLIETQGTRDNRDRLLSRQADLAIVQSGAVSMKGIVALAPLYYDVMFVVARKGRGIGRVRDLTGKNVAIGLSGSGMRSSAEQLLRHYDIGIDELTNTDHYFLDMQTDESIDAAIITTGLINPDLEKLLATGRFNLVPIAEADAVCVRNPHFKPFDIPTGLYAHIPSVPAQPVRTIATTAFIAARDDVSSMLVNRTLTAIYESDVRADVPVLIDIEQASTWQQEPLHTVSRQYFDPYAEIGVLATFMETIAAGKELLLAVVAGVYLIWDRWRRLKEREREAELQAMKNRLDKMLDETLRIERAQMESQDRKQLKDYLDEVTRIKLEALDELSHEDLRGDRMFQIFLMQCANLISKIQSKMSLVNDNARTEK